MSDTKLPLCAGLMLLVLTARAYCQTTFATITGTVTDATGAVVASVTVPVIEIGRAHV